MGSNCDRPPWLLAQPAYLASQMSRYGRQDLEGVLAEHGLRLAHYGILVALADLGPLAQQQLADALDHDKSHLVRNIDHLEADGLVTRVRDRGDRRRNRVTITDAGRALTKRLQTAEQRSQEKLLASLTAKERQTLTDLLRRVLDANDRQRHTTGSPQPLGE